MNQMQTNSFTKNQFKRNKKQTYPDRINDIVNINSALSTYHPIILKRNNIEISLNATEKPIEIADMKVETEKSLLDIQYPQDKDSSRKYSRDSGCESTSNDESISNNSKAKYKTELCKFYEINGNCKFGSKCVYAHGKENLRVKVQLKQGYRTRKCKQFHDKGYCPYGNRCQFAHSLKNNSINKALNQKKMSYYATLLRMEDIVKGKTIYHLPRLRVFEDIVKNSSNLPSTLYEDIKAILLIN